MRGPVLYLVLLCLAVVVVGISLAILRYLHWSAFSYVIIIPIWVTILAVLVMVAKVTFKGSRSGGSQ